MFVNNNKKNRQGGFTLIELIVVMMIMAIMVATAAPKFLNFQRDAREAALNGLKASIDSASQLVYGKSAIHRNDIKSTGSIGSAAGNDLVATNFGYPAATMKGIGAAVTGVGDESTNTNSDWFAVTDGVNLRIKFRSSKDDAATNCSVLYTAATSTTSPATAVVSATEC